MSLLSVKNLKIAFKSEGTTIPIVDGVSFELEEKCDLGIVGESGCGKSLTAKSLLGLLNPRIFSVTADELNFNGKSLLNLKESDWQKIRGNDISMIFQNPMTSLNPVIKCGKQILEAIKLHQQITDKEAVDQCMCLLTDMGIKDPKRIYHSYPHELSGGLKQRIMIAMALSCRPKMLIADEPTTALDVTIQAQILELLRGLQKKYDMSLIIISHNIGVIQELARDLIVMYAGHIIEKGPTTEILKNPNHPYTIGLLRAMPQFSNHKRLYNIKGSVPRPVEYPQGCRFIARCSLAEAKCSLIDVRSTENEAHYSQCIKRNENLLKLMDV